MSNYHAIQTEKGISKGSIVKADDEEESNELNATDLDGFEFSFIDLKPQYQPDTHIASNISNDVINISHVKKDEGRSTNRGRRTKKIIPRRTYVPRERHVIQHNYHDHANDNLDFDELTSDTLTLESPKKKGGVAVPFPLKLHELLEKVDEEGLQHIVSWQPHGRAFVVREPKTFVADLMPRFFRQTKLTSFQRQLNLYGFSRLTRGADAGGYYHELFLRGKPHLTTRMIRTKIKGTGYKAASNPACEPDFYNMSPVGPAYDDSNCNDGEPNVNFYSNVARSHIPIVTPTTFTSGNFNSVYEGHKDHQNCPNPFVYGELTSDPSTMSPPKPFLKPRQPSPARSVKMGHEYFHYMESVNPSDSAPFACKNDDGCSRSSCIPSPIMFEKISSEETSVRDNEEDTDPLAIFLADMGGNFDDELLFTSDIEAEDKPLTHSETHTSIYEV